jgi:hypothetical protein
LIRRANSGSCSYLQFMSAVIVLGKPCPRPTLHLALSAYFPVALGLIDLSPKRLRTVPGQRERHAGRHVSGAQSTHAGSSPSRCYRAVANLYEPRGVRVCPGFLAARSGRRHRDRAEHATT